MASSTSYEQFEEEALDKAPRHIKDPIHEFMTISPKLSRFIDTKQFQRLRYIKQLGTTSYVWPGGSHTRFEHSLGVAHLARLMVTHLQKSQPELKITDRDVECVEIAGLCHDLGHGPWSHVFDGMFIPAALPNTKWKHEDGSEMMFDALVKENNVPISARDQEFVKALIAGNHSRTPHEKPFLFDVVANKRNGLDVDKIEYIHRDSHMIGDPIRLSAVRLVHSARVLDDQICYNIKTANQIYELCASRFKLHKMIYNHKAAKAIEYMIVDGLLAADKYLKITKRISNAEEYLWLTDDIMQRIQSSKEPELAEARAIFERIPKRELYKCVDNKTIDWPFRQIFREHITSEKIVEAALALTVPGTPTYEADGDSLPASDCTDTSPPIGGLSASDVIVDFSTMHYGMKEKNPLDFVRFFSKNNLDQSQKAARGDYSNLMPQYFAEDLLRVYTKKPQFFGLVQAGYRAVLADMPDQLGLKLGLQAVDQEKLEEDRMGVVGANVLPPAPTPPETEAPTTPKAHSRNASFNFGSAVGSIGVDGTPFSNNSFTTVAPNYAPPSPTRRGIATKKAKGKAKTTTPTNITPKAGTIVGKRRREEETLSGTSDASTKRRK